MQKNLTKKTISPAITIIPIGLSLLFSTVFSSPLKNDESLLFIPSIAYELNGQIAIEINAWIYEKERKLGMTTLLTNYLDIDKNALSQEELARLYERSQLFRVDSKRGRAITFTLNSGQTYTLPKTEKEGRTSMTIMLPKSDLNLTTINYFAKQTKQKENQENADQGNTNQGTSYFVTPKGLSVITDIDDTIKDSNVLDTKALLRNTFLYEFKAIAQMNTAYKRINQSQKNVAFHYLSSSPIQLYPALQVFIDQNAFPKGSFHLREATTWNTTTPSKDASQTHKRSNIEKLLNAYPERDFLLIGDSGEKDPEIYAKAMRDFPTRIRCIAIRDVTEEDRQSARYQEIFAQLDPEKWIIFTDPKMIMKCL